MFALVIKIDMKNIHLLSTEKPSRLILQGSELVLSKYLEINEGFSEFNKHIYITNDEEIKEGFVLNTFNNSIYKIVPDNSSREILAEPNILPLCAINKEHYFKIILTTDQDFIADGVQAIDDEFLEWFVENPNCESAKVDVIPVNEFGSEITVGGYGFDKFNYKIIIPQEEPKQETLEEAAEKKYPLKGELEIHFYMVRRLAFIEGAEWQMERSYSEEDLLSAFEAGMMFIGEDKGSFREWFEQFKKK
jgi:hypothetical protein